MQRSRGFSLPVLHRISSMSIAELNKLNLVPGFAQMIAANFLAGRETQADCALSFQHTLAMHGIKCTVTNLRTDGGMVRATLAGLPEDAEDEFCAVLNSKLGGFIETEPAAG